MLWMLTQFALAGNAVDLKIVRHGQEGSNTPELIFQVREPLTQLQSSIKCGSFSKSITGPQNKGDVSIPLLVKTGTHNCTGTLDIEMEDGSTGSMPLKFEVTMHPPLKMTIPTETVDLEKGTLSVKLDRPAAAYQINLFDSAQDEAGQGYTKVDPAFNLGLTEVSWEALSDDIAMISVEGKDIYGFTTSMHLYPWHYDIPHEDVIFASNQSDIPAGETHKLTAVQKDVQTVVQKYSKFAVVNLYVAGYTDTVGNADHNLSLSEARAKSIAKWFKSNGFTGDIYYQGFGESALAVATADGVDEAQNRRVLYVVAATEPAKSASFPKSNWTRLP